MEEKYKDWAIKYDEDAETFVATDKMENMLKSQKLKELKKKIDKFSFKRIPILYKSYSESGLKIGEVTSIADPVSSWRSHDIWISCVDKDGDKSRTKTDINHLYKQTDNNMKISKEITMLIEEKDRLDEKIEKMQEQLERITKEDLGLDVNEGDK